MLHRICISLIGSMLLTHAVSASSVAEQLLPEDWSTAFCSPCVFQNALALSTGSRMFASFGLESGALLDGARLPVGNNPFGSPGDFSVSIWSTPFAGQGPLFETLVRVGEYTLSKDSTGYIDIALPAWNVGEGSYWLSVFGANGYAFQWGGISGSGDDRRFINGEPFLREASTSPQNYQLGFSLRGRDPVVTPIGGTLPLLLGGVGLLALLRRKANS